MKRALAAALAATAAFTLSACIPEEVATTQPTAAPAAPVAPAQPEVSASDIADSAYLELVRETFPQFVAVSDEPLISAAKTACDAIDAGVAPLELAEMAASSLDLSDYDAAYFIGLGIGAYCPENVGAIA